MPETSTSNRFRPRRAEDADRRPWASVLLASLLVAAILAGAYAYYSVESRRVRRAMSDNLASIGALKAAQVHQWRKERIGDGLRLANSPFVRKAAEAWLAAPDDPGLLADWQERLDLERSAYNYENVIVADLNGGVLLAALGPSAGIMPETRRTIEAAKASLQPVFSSVFAGPRGEAFVDLVAPILGVSRDPLAFAILRINPERYPFPRISDWPVPTASGEAFLVVRDGAEIRLIGALRGRPAGESIRSIPITETTLIGVRAALGERGVIGGRDYAGVEVIASVHEIPESDWIVMAKVNEAELFAEARYRAWMLSVLVAAFIGLVLAAVALNFRRRQARVLRELYRSEHDRAEVRGELSAALYSIADGVITTDRSGIVRHLNRVAERLTGWTESEALGRPIAEVLRIVDEDGRTPIQDPAARVLSGEASEIEARRAVVVSREGVERPIAVNVAPIRDDASSDVGLVFVLRDRTEEHRAERVLLASESRYRSLFAASPQPMWVFDARSLQFLEVNEAAVAQYGYSRQEFLGMTLADIRPAEDLRQLKESFARLARGRPGGDRVWRHRRKDGSIILVEIAAHPLDFDGRRAHLVIVNDVTERRRAEEALRHSQRQLSNAQRIAHMGGWEIDLRSNSRYWSEETYRIFGASEDGADRDIDALLLRIHPDDRERLAAERVRVLEGGGALDIEYRIVRPDGTVRHVHGQGEVTFDETGKAIFISGTVQDITERKRAEEALRENQALVRLASRIARLGGWRVDLPKGIIVSSDEMCAILEIPAGTTRTLREALLTYPPEWRSRISQAFARCIREGTPIDEEVEVVTETGRRLWVRTIGQALRSPEGTITGLQGATQDITQRKREEGVVARLEEQLRQSQKLEAVGRLAGGVAHDFNNMLTVILGHGQMAMDELGADHPVSADLREIIEAGKRSADLTRQLLAFARQQTIAPRVIDLNDTVASMFKMLGRLIGEEIELLWKPGKNLWTVKMDPSQIHQILANLAVNARDAIAGVGRISIETSNVEIDAAYAEANPGASPGEYVCLTVTDTGCGMSREVLSRIFDPFFTTKETGRGTGLGLATVYGILQQNGGFVNVYSEPGEGAAFRVYLPRHASGEKPAGPEESELIPVGTETILVVEDEAALLSLVVRLLGELQYTVLPAGNPDQAIGMSEKYEGRIDLLLTDVVMPQMSGRDLVERLARIHPEMKSLYMSGYTADIIAHHGVLHEGIQFLQKPFTKRSLALAIREALGKPAGAK